MSAYPLRLLSYIGFSYIIIKKLYVIINKAKMIPPHTFKNLQWNLAIPSLQIPATSVLQPLTHVPIEAFM